MLTATATLLGISLLSPGRGVEGLFEAGPSVLEDRRAVGDEQALEGGVEEAGDRRAELPPVASPRLFTFGGPRGRRHAHAAAAGADQRVGDNERAPGPEKENDLPLEQARAGERLDAAGQGLAGPERVRHLACRVRDRALVRPDRGS